MFSNTGIQDMKLFFTGLLLIVLLSCNDSDSSSPYNEILSKPPFASITDSIRKEPGRDDLYFRRAVALNKNGFPEPALTDFRKAWSLVKKEEYAISISNILLEKKPDSAVVFLKESTRELPASWYLPILLARSYMALGKTDEAISACDDALQNEPNQVNALLLKAELLEKKGDKPAMIAALEKAYHIIPSNREVSDKLAYQYAETKNPKALQIADSLIAKDTQRLFADPYYVKGMYYANINDKAKAIQLFDATIKADHRYLNAYIEKGKILFEQKKTNEALKTFTLANAVTPSFPDAWYWIGRCQEVLGDKAAAKENYEKAYELDNTFTEAKEAAASIK
jgi:tetratricopeptide (TPR) repeat protein